jgi:hypothetical protein
VIIKNLKTPHGLDIIPFFDLHNKNFQWSGYPVDHKRTLRLCCIKDERFKFIDATYNIIGADMKLEELSFAEMKEEVNDLISEQRGGNNLWKVRSRKL